MPASHCRSPAADLRMRTAKLCNYFQKTKCVRTHLYFFAKKREAGASLFLVGFSRKTVKTVVPARGLPANPASGKATHPGTVTDRYTRGGLTPGLATDPSASLSGEAPARSPGQKPPRRQNLPLRRNRSHRTGSPHRMGSPLPSDGPPMRMHPLPPALPCGRVPRPARHRPHTVRRHAARRTRAPRRCGSPCGAPKIPAASHPAARRRPRPRPRARIRCGCGCRAPAGCDGCGRCRR